MGFLNSLKKIFSKEEKQIIKISIDELDSRIDENVRKIENSNSEILANLLEDLGASLRGLSISIENLKKGEIKERVREDTRREIEGYREEYLRLILELSERIRKKLENEINEEKLGSVNEELNLFAKSSARAYFFTRDAFIETRVIHSRIEEIRKNLNVFFEKLNEFKKRKERFNELKIVLEEYRSLVSFDNNFKKEISMLENETDLKKERLKEQKNERERILGSEAYKSNNELIKKKKEIFGEKGMIELRLRDLIDSKLLERYAYQEEDKEKLKFIKAYTENPVTSINQDKELVIMNVIEDIKHGISIGKIEVKKGKKEKMIEKLNFDKELLNELRERLLRLDNEISEIDMKTRDFVSEEMFKDIEKRMIGEISETEEAIGVQKEKKTRNEKKTSEKRAELIIKTREVLGKEFELGFE